MNPGDKLRFRGPAGAPFVVTIGAAFTAKYIQTRVNAGEWTPVEPEPVPEPELALPPAQAPKRRGRPPKNPTP